MYECHFALRQAILISFHLRFSVSNVDVTSGRQFRLLGYGGATCGAKFVRRDQSELTKYGCLRGVGTR